MTRGKAAEQRFNAGEACGIVRLPIRPSGWVTVSTGKGSASLELTEAPRWRAVFKSPSLYGDVLVRAGSSLSSCEIALLHRGDIVQQMGPEVRIGDLLRMPIVTLGSHWRDWKPEESPEGPSQEKEAAEKILRSGVHKGCVGWVTILVSIDACAASSPVFFEACALAKPQAPKQEPFCYQ
ncbi:unnamed protein product [Polarella glacialis]|uniref:Uncharacterized protein n=1 Tax=Polarella glacialis TaxID=89957 RepID=A0A813FC84_POLGL|nr:unnamed protein product [Polarella glacialis]